MLNINWTLEIKDMLSHMISMKHHTMCHLRTTEDDPPTKYCAANLAGLMY